MREYAKFRKIDGSHPWRDVSPEGYVDYLVRYREGGRVLYFNFDLAREMGLIPSDHPRRMNARLERSILRAFSIVIINEYDQKYRPELLKKAVKNQKYMATRYLQSQHSNKQGKTSGDGRSIWNGCVTHRGVTFDISSRGTGGTCLSPGFHEAAQPVPTGTDKVGYASGLADLDEMLAGAIMSEIFYKEGIPTERTLTVIDYPDKTSVGVRVAPNLIRPAHIFRYLKSGQWEEVKHSFDYFLKREEDNGTWKLSKTREKRYAQALRNLTVLYAKLAAVMEEEYIFNWLAWDGDNMLASGALLDYGSIRQFAAKHSKYRYEDVDRYSTCLSEQRYWARRLIQTFVQTVDFILTKEKKNIADFDKDPHLALFDREFEKFRQHRMLWRTGFEPEQIDHLMANEKDAVEAFGRALNYFEDLKTVRGEEATADGINHPPVFLVRHILRELPVFVLIGLKKKKEEGWPVMPAEEFCREMAASYVHPDDLQLNEYRRQKAQVFQELYRRLVQAAGPDPVKTLETIVERSTVINHQYRKTGDGLTWIVDEAIKAKKRMERKQIQAVVDRFIDSQVLVPGKWQPITPQELRGISMKARLLRRMQETVKMYNETI